jgi:Putative prokaryotic signal transducing protein
MMKVFEAQHHVEAHFLKGLLQTAGISAEVHGEALFTTVEGGTAIPGMRPSVWILEDQQQQQAKEILATYTTGEGVPSYSKEPWKCPRCGEIHEPQFSACWNCGTPIPSQVEPTS